MEYNDKKLAKRSVVSTSSHLEFVDRLHKYIPSLVL